MVYDQLPQPNALLRNEKGFQLVGLGWAGQWSSDVATAVVTAAVDYLDKRDVIPTSFSITFARATPKDLSDLRRFCSELINVLTWQTWGVFDGDPVEVKEKAADLSEEALALKIGNWVMQNINLTDGLERVLMGYSLLVNNTCNLESSSLEWRPELALMRSFVEANDDQEKE